MCDRTHECTMKTCKGCGIEFWDHRANVMFHSEDCRKQFLDPFPRVDVRRRGGFVTKGSLSTKGKLPPPRRSSDAHGPTGFLSQAFQQDLEQSIQSSKSEKTGFPL
jgi:hypothetical protein